MDFSILGPLEVSEDGRPVALQGGKPRALLAVLLLHAGRPVPTGELIDALWGERPPETVAKVLQTYVSQLRKSLGDVLETRPGAYQLNIGPDELDLLVFERRAAEGRRELADGHADEAAAALREALALWRGPALAEFRTEPFALAELRRLEELRLAAIEDRIDADLASGLSREVVAELEGARRRAPAARAPPRPADARALPRGSPGRRAARLPRGPDGRSSTSSGSSPAPSSSGSSGRSSPRTRR